MVQYLHLLDPGIPIDSGIPWEFNGESHTPFNKTTPLHGPKYIWLVVDLPLWKIMDFVSWDDDIPNIYIYIYVWKNKKCSKPPTRYDLILF